MSPGKAATYLSLAVALATVLACTRNDWIDRTLVTENVTGVWSGSIGEGAWFRNVRLELQHDGAKVSGVIRFPPGSTSTLIEGSVAGDTFTFKDTRGNDSGELVVGGDEMAGRFLGPSGTRHVSLRRAMTR